MSLNANLGRALEGMEFPPCFTDANFNFAQESPQVLAAHGIEAWALCMAGNEPPKSFGEVLVKIRAAIGMQNAPTADNLVAFAKWKGWLK